MRRRIDKERDGAAARWLVNIGGSFRPGEVDIEAVGPDRPAQPSNITVTAASGDSYAMAL